MHISVIRRPWCHFAFYLLVMMVLSACGGPRSPQIGRSQALEWHDPMEVRVVQIFDGMRHSRDPHVSHLVEVEFMRGESPDLTVGQRFVLPYDAWTVGKDPPKRGTAVMITPAMWVRGKK